MGKFLQVFGNVLGTVAGVLACTFASAAMLVETRFIGRMAWVGVVFWGLLAFAGLRIRRKGSLKIEADEAVRYKQALNQVARRTQGRVTALELATALGVDVEQARAYLQMLVGMGEATPELTEQFTQYYQIGGIVPQLADAAPPPPPPSSPARPSAPLRQAPPPPPPVAE